MACIILVTCNEEDVCWEGGTRSEWGVKDLAEMGHCLTAGKSATVYQDAGHASAVAAEYDGALIAKYGRRVYDFKVVAV